MIVDPNTGEIIDDGASANSFGQQVVANVGKDVNSNRLIAMSEHVPTAKVSAGWNAFRGERTILKGLGHKFPGARTTKPGISGMIRGTLHPSNWTKMGSYEAMGTFEGGEHYTPFNFLSSNFTNRPMGRMLGKGIKSGSGIGNRIASHTLNPSQIADIKNGGAVPDMFSGGVYSRMSASSRIAGWGRTDATVAARYAKNSSAFLAKTDAKLFSAAESVYGKGLAGATKGQLADLHMMSVRGPASQWIGGYFRGASGLGDGSAAFANSVGRTAFERGANTATRHLADAGLERIGGKLAVDTTTRVGESLAAKGIEKVGLRTLGTIAGEAGANVALKAGLGMGARAIGMAIPGVNVVLTAMMAYDLTKMGISAMKGGAEFAKDAYKSFQGSLYKPAMGMGYRDTEVAATSRARGVQAIQNSRLNARSALGSEAAPLAAHFG